MAQLELRYWPTRHGRVASYDEAASRSEDGAVVLFLHGALRHSEALLPWRQRVAGLAQVMFMDLPGHGRSEPSGPASVVGMAATLSDAIRASLAGRQVVVVGESLGGTVALALAGAVECAPVQAVIAADPPMTTGKLWNVAAAFRTVTTAGGDTFTDRLARESFGLHGPETIDLIYYPLVGALAKPALILAGDVPLHPPRRTERVACVFDDVDQHVVRNFYAGKAQVETLTGCGHLVLSDAAEACRDRIARTLTQLGGSRGTRL